MNIFTTIFRWLGGNATSQRSGSQPINPAVNVYEDSPVVNVDGAMQVSTVWACVSLLVETIGSLPLIVYDTDAQGNRSPSSDRLFKILNAQPNTRQTSQEFWEQMMLNYYLRGNAYARIQRDSRGAALSLWPLAADQVDVVLADDGSLIYRYYFQGTNNKEFIFLENDILHIRGMGNGVVGMSRLDYMRSSVGLAIKAQNHTTKTYSKNARRPGILMSNEVLTDAQRVAIKNNFSDITTGNEKELYLLEAQFKFDPLGMSPADIQLLESRQFSVQDLARWFGVPSVLINDTRETTSLGSSVAQVIDGFHRLTLRPQLERIEQSLMKRVLTTSQRTKGIITEFNLDALLRASLSERMDIYSKGVQNGIYNRNEPRKRENLSPYEGGEIFTAQTNLMPVDLLGTQSSQGAPPEEAIQQ